MTAPIEFFRWWIVDERTGKRRLTTYKLSRVEAAKAFPKAHPDLHSSEIRNLPGPRESTGNTGPDRRWSDSEPPL
jgi:hypothetical protein